MALTHFNAKKIAVSGPVKKLYSVIKKHSGAVGGYGHHGPVYGEVTMGSFQKVVDFLKEYCDLNESSSFLDIGAGLGKPNLHVAMDPGVSMSFGIELENLRHQLSLYNLANCLLEVEQLKQKPSVYFAHHDATHLGSLNPFSHIYMFDVGFPPDVLVSLANAFNKSTTAKVLVCFTKPRHIISTYGFAVRLIGNIKTTMCGSSEGHTAYIYSATPAIPTKPLPTTDTTPAVTAVEEATKEQIEEGEGEGEGEGERKVEEKERTDITTSPSKSSTPATPPFPITPIRAQKRRQRQPQISEVFKTAKKGLTVSAKKKPRILNFSTDNSVAHSKKAEVAVDEVVAAGYIKCCIPLPQPGSTKQSSQPNNPKLEVGQYVSWLNEQLRQTGGLLQDTGRSKRRKTQTSNPNYCY